ncbi:regulator of PEP synthase PpsR (kinase-PPPase family) [Luteibacter sp. HA06]|jgi:regulator of PEP synthase PpsR (kinase-PPPase family)
MDHSLGKPPMRRTVFFISDSTGITAETIGNSMLAQFEGVQFDTHRLPFIDNPQKAEAASLRIKTKYAQDGQRPIVVNTMTSRALCDIVAGSGALMLDVFAPFIDPLEAELGTKQSGAVNRSHGLVDFERYEARINATNYALAHDDGLDVDYNESDLVLVGVSRSGKTPTCLYMALHYGVCAANYPLTDDDLDKLELPTRLRPYRSRLFGLTIDPNRLAQIREQRRPGSRYATLKQCRWELEQADRLMRRENIPVLNTTHTSIEEISSKIFEYLGIERHMY